MSRIVKVFFISVFSLLHITAAEPEQKTMLDDIYDALVSISGDPFNQMELKEIALHPFTPGEFTAAKKCMLTHEFSSKQLRELSVKKQKQLGRINMGKTTYLAKDPQGTPVGALLLSVKKPMLTIEKVGINPKEDKHQITLASILVSTIQLAKQSEQKWMKILVDEKDTPTIQTLLYLEFKQQDNGTNKDTNKQVWVLDLNLAKKATKQDSVPKPLARPYSPINPN